MIKSMTGYGRSEVEVGGMIFNVEIKTLNSRYRDIIIRMPPDLQQIETEIRSLISKNIYRGRIEVILKIESLLDKADYELVLNESLARAYMQIFERLSRLFSINISVNADTFCHLRDVIIQKPKELDIEVIKNGLMKAIKKALNYVSAMREQEGKILEYDLSKRIDLVKEKLFLIKERAPIVVEEYRDRLKNNISKLLEGLDINIDEARINQELVIFAERSDITEEIVRLESHLIQFNNYLKKDEPVGRRLDFLIQEMNREINTIGSKASDTLISSLVVDIKGEIEKLREQVQNIE